MAQVDGPRRLPIFLYILAFFAGDRAFVPAFALGYIGHRTLTAPSWSQNIWILVSVTALIALYHGLSTLRRLYILSTGTLTRSGASITTHRKSSGTKTYTVSMVYDDAAGVEHERNQVYAQQFSATWVSDCPVIAYEKLHPNHAVNLGEFFMPLTADSRGNIHWNFHSGIRIWLRTFAACIAAVSIVILAVWVENSTTKKHWPDGTPVYQSR